MTAINDIVDLVHPAVSGMHIIISDEVWVLFDRELDENSVRENFFVTGPDQDTWSGPDLLLYKQRLQVGDEDDILSSPNFHGFVAGVFSFEKINLADLDSYAGYDYGGHGTLWRTKAVFTPSKPLSPNTEYEVHIVGDESDSDDLSTGLKTRTIFDTVNGANVGTGEATFVGTYTGTTASETFHVRMTVGGQAGTAKFLWYRGSNPLLTYGPLTAYRGEVLLGDGISIRFTSGTFEIGDSFSVIVKTPTVFTGNLIWPFTTGTGTLQELPTTVATAITGAPVESSTTATDEFSVLSTSPVHRATDLDSPFEGDMSIVIQFSDNIDEDTVDTSSVQVNIEPVNGDDTDVSSIVASGIVTPTLEVDGDELTVTIASGIINENNIITVTLEDSVASEDGISLSADYEFYFTSRYSPLYTSWRRVMLDFGAFPGDVPRDTVNLAIFEASMTADQLSWATGSAAPTGIAAYYQWVRREFATCKAAETLLLNALGVGQGLRMKRLADLEVQYDPAILEQGLQKALGCMGKFEATLHGKGLSKRRPVVAVKGASDPDSPPVGRGWTAPNRGMPVATAKSQSNRRWSSGYYSPSAGRTGKGNSH